MGRPAGWMKELTGRSPMKSPGAPSVRREVWREIAKGVTSEGGCDRCWCVRRQRAVGGSDTVVACPRWSLVLCMVVTCRFVSGRRSLF